jgi:hypothetical protein
MFHLMMQASLRKSAAIAPGTSAACTATLSSAPRPTTGTKAKVPNAGCERSQYDPPVYPAVPPISYNDYPKSERNALKRRLEVEDSENVKAMPFEKGELVFTLQEEGVDAHGYVLPLSVAVVTKVWEGGLKADVTYMLGETWDGVFNKAKFKESEGKKAKARFWTEKGMGKEGVVLMRGGQTKSGKLNAKTKLYVLEYLGTAQFYQHAKRKEVRGKAAAEVQHPKKTTKAEVVKKGSRNASQAPIEGPSNSCLRADRPRAVRVYESEPEELSTSGSDEGNGSWSGTSDASSTYRLRILSQKPKPRVTAAEIEKDRQKPRR